MMLMQPVKRIKADNAAVVIFRSKQESARIFQCFKYKWIQPGNSSCRKRNANILPYRFRYPTVIQKQRIPNPQKHFLHEFQILCNKHSGVKRCFNVLFDPFHLLIGFRIDTENDSQIQSQIIVPDDLFNIGFLGFQFSHSPGTEVFITGAVHLTFLFQIILSQQLSNRHIKLFRDHHHFYFRIIDVFQKATKIISCRQCRHKKITYVVISQNVIVFRQLKPSWCIFRSANQIFLRTDIGKICTIIFKCFGIIYYFISVRLLVKFHTLIEIRKYTAREIIVIDHRVFIQIRQIITEVISIQGSGQKTSQFKFSCHFLKVLMKPFF